MHSTDIFKSTAGKLLLIFLLAVNYYFLSLKWWDNQLPPGFEIPDATGMEVLECIGAKRIYILGMILCFLCICFAVRKYIVCFAIGAGIGYLMMGFSTVYVLHFRESIFDPEMGILTKQYIMSLGYLVFSFIATESILIVTFIKSGKE